MMCYYLNVHFQGQRINKIIKTAFSSIRLKKHTVNHEILKAKGVFSTYLTTHRLGGS